MGAHLAGAARGIVLTVEAWHRRYRRQAAWTREMREHLFPTFKIGPGSKILEVGCGTGAVLKDLPSTAPKSPYGMDIELDYLAHAATVCPAAKFTCADVLALPYTGNYFDLTFCHFFLLWVRDPAAALAEMKRVTRPGGVVAALAEPDYGGRIDYPAPLANLGRLQGFALRRQGADTHMGRQLAALFNRAGLRQVRAGLIGGEWGRPYDTDAWENEWAVLETDLAGAVPPEELLNLRRMDAAAWQKGERILFVPTFYAFGIVPG